MLKLKCKGIYCIIEKQALDIKREDIGGGNEE
jgi:hypothetical protein